MIAAGESAFVIQLDETVPASRRRSAACGCGADAPARGQTRSRRRHRRPVALPLVPGEARGSSPRPHPDYLIEKRIGGGGMGEVFLARQLSTNRPVAIKMMVPTGAASDKAKDYFRREMMVLKDLLMPNGLCHPNIVAFYDIFEIDGQFQLVMEYVAGKNALDWVKALAAAAARSRPRRGSAGSCSRRSTTPTPRATSTAT